MKRLVTKWFGVHLLEGDAVVDRRLFPPQPEAVADRLEAVRRGEVLTEERQLAGDARPAVADVRLKEIGDVQAGVEPGIEPDAEHDLSTLRQALLILAGREARAAGASGDRFVAHAVGAMDELTRSANTLVEKLREWYAIADPEGSRKEPDQAAFARNLAAGVDTEPSATGVPFSAAQAEAVGAMAKAVASLFDERERLEKRVSEEVRAVAPCLSGVVGDFVAARLIAHAGGLDDLAFLPASTVQTLGAESALFEHLRHQKPPPKHGVLFQHHLVNTAPARMRGRIARMMAAKAVQAARIDRFGGNGERAADAARLLGEIEAQVARIKSQPRRPPARKAPEPGRGRR